MKNRPCVALLRGINVGGHNKIPMAGLREVASQLGLERPRTYIQSGNLLFESSAPSASLEQELERGIRSAFGASIPVIVRDAARWARYLTENPFPEEAALSGNLVMLSLSRSTPSPDAASVLQQRATAGERVALVGDGLWVHYPEGAGRSKLTPTLFDRAAGSPVTARNWRTVVKLDEMLRE